MPLYKKIEVTKHTKVLIWNIKESEDILKNGIQLTENCKERLKHMKSEIHRCGFLSIRQLLKIAGYKSADLYYDEHGKPHLIDGYNIAISHSFVFSCIIISKDTVVGIDIEKQRAKIKLIANRFIGYEACYLSKEDIKRLTVIWCIKESLYKAFATKGLSFKKHTKIIPFNKKENKTTGWIVFHGKVEKHQAIFFEFEGFTFAYTLKY